MLFAYDIETIQTIARYAAWYPVVIYSLANVPQVIKSYRLKTTISLSSAALYIMFTNALTGSTFCILRDLPTPHKVGAVISFLGIGTLCRIHYLYSNKEHQSFLAKLFSGTFIVFTTGAVAALWYPTLVGNIAGWIFSTGCLVARIPQIYKIYRIKHLYGVSFFQNIMTGSADIISIAVAFILNLPIQEKIGLMYTLTSRLARISLFYIYRENTAKEYEKRRQRASQ